MSKPALLVCVMLLSLGCAHKRPYAPKAAAPSGVLSTFQRQVSNAVDAGEGDLALAALRRRLAAEPGNLQVRLALIRRYREAGLPELALDYARIGTERFPDSADMQVEMARALRALGLRAEAAEALERFFRRNPQLSPDVPAWLGILRDELGQWQQGEAAHRAALALAPARDDLFNNLGYNLLRQGRRQEARQMLERALALNPGSKTARNNLGLALAAEPAPALEQFQKVADPATAHNNLACTLIEQGRYAEARKELEIALGYNRNHPAALANLSLLSELDGQAAAVGPGGRPPGRWARFWSAAWRILAGVDKQPSPRP